MGHRPRDRELIPAPAVQRPPGASLAEPDSDDVLVEHLPHAVTVAAAHGTKRAQAAAAGPLAGFMALAFPLQTVTA